MSRRSNSQLGFSSVVQFEVAPPPCPPHHPPPPPTTPLPAPPPPSPPHHPPPCSAPPHPATSSTPPQAQSATDNTHRLSSAAEPSGSGCVSKATEAFSQVGWPRSCWRASWTWRKLPTGGSSTLCSGHALAPASSRPAGRARRGPDDKNGHGAEPSASPHSLLPQPSPLCRSYGFSRQMR